MVTTVHLLISVLAFAFLGGIIGFIFRRSVVLQMFLGILISCSVVSYFVAREGWFSSKYSLQEKIDGLQEVAGVYVLYAIAPTVLGALFVSQWLLRRRPI